MYWSNIVCRLDEAELDPACLSVYLKFSCCGKNQFIAISGQVLLGTNQLYTLTGSGCNLLQINIKLASWSKILIHKTFADDYYIYC